MSKNLLSRCSALIAVVAVTYAVSAAIAQAEIQSSLATTIYSNNFSVAAGPEWSSQARDATPLGSRSFLGQFTNDIVTLSLGNLLAHDSMTVAFDLFIIRTWDGNNGPDQWNLSVEGGPTLLNTTFNAFFNAQDRQAYPGSYPGGDFPAHTGASEVGTLGVPVS